MIGVLPKEVPDVQLAEYFVAPDRVLPTELRKGLGKSSRTKTGRAFLQKRVVLELQQQREIRRTSTVRKRDPKTKKYVYENKSRILVLGTGKTMRVEIPAGAEIGYFCPESKTKCFIRNVLIEGVPGQLTIQRNNTASVRVYS